MCALEGDPIDSQSIVKSIVESEMFPIDSQSIKYFYFVFFQVWVGQKTLIKPLYIVFLILFSSVSYKRDLINSES